VVVINKDEVTTEVFEGDLKIAIVGEKPRRISKEYDDCKFF